MRKTILTSALLLCSMVAQAKVVLPSVYTDNMVLQQKSTLRIHGKATPKSDVTLQTGWSRAAVTVKSDARGHWYMEVATPKAGGPYELTFSDGEDVTLKNVLVGEVWLGSGQSNMEMPLAGWGKVFNYEEEIANANFPQIRLFQVKNVLDLKERDCFSLEYAMGGWQECSPKTVPEFSALCYFFACRLWDELKVPVGVIDDNWGGTPAQAWTRAEALGRVRGFEDHVAWTKKVGAKNLAAEIEQQTKEWKEAFTTKDIGLSAARPWYGGDVDDTRWDAMAAPGNWEASKLPALDGVVWMRKTIDITAAQAGKDMELSLGCVDDADMTYFNGEKVGECTGHKLERVYKVPGKLVKEGKNTITVRVTDMGTQGGLCGPAEKMFCTVGGARIALAGEWKYAVGMNAAHLAARPREVNSHYPSVLYNAMISPLVDFPVKGIIWYQGCSNVGAAVQYESLFQAMIQDWRLQWQQPDMPFYFAQLANYLTPRDVQPDSEWALLREAQEKALKLHNTGMACNIDIGDAKDIHPKSKRELGRRMAAIALHKTYGMKNVAYTAPVYKGYQIVGDEMHIEFDYPEGSEPFIEGRDLPGFTICGTDNKWHVGRAWTQDGKVIVTSNKVKNPVAVRYGWADNPTCTLRTKGNFPVTPFRTDNWKVSNNN